MIFSCTKVFGGEPCGEWVRISCALRAFQHVQTLRENVQCWFQVDTEKKVRFFRPQAYVHQLRLCQQIMPPCQRRDHGSFTRRHQADDGWNWIYLTPRYTVNTRNFMVSFIIWIGLHQDELLDCCFFPFKCAGTAPFFLLWWNSGRWAASFSLVDPWNIMWINPSPVHISYTPMQHAVPEYVFFAPRTRKKFTLGLFDIRGIGICAKRLQMLPSLKGSERDHWRFVVFRLANQCRDWASDFPTLQSVPYSMLNSQAISYTLFTLWQTNIAIESHHV